MTTLQRIIERFALPFIVVLFMTACLDSNLTAPDVPDGGFRGPFIQEGPPPKDSDADGEGEWIATNGCTGRAPVALRQGEDHVCLLP